MKRRLCLLTILLLCVLHAACAGLALPGGSVVYRDPGYYGEVALIIDADGVFTIVEEQQDAYGNAWGKLKSGAGWVALSQENYPLTLFEGDRLYAGPGYDFDLVKTVNAEETRTVLAQAWDSADNLWGRTDAGWVFLRSESAMVYRPIHVDFADEELLAKGPYEYILADESLNACEIAIYANEPLTDVRLFQHEHDGDACVEKTLQTLNAVTVEKPIVAAVAFYGDTTAYGVSLTDASGVRHCFEITLSGMDGSLVLNACPEHE